MDKWDGWRSMGAARIKAMGGGFMFKCSACGESFDAQSIPLEAAASTAETHMKLCPGKPPEDEEDPKFREWELIRMADQAHGAPPQVRD